MKILGIICARGGSKGVPGKNVRELIGRPLISYSIKALKAWGKCNDIICSSDSNEILEVATNEGICIIKRPNFLASDTANKIDVWKHVLMALKLEWGEEYDYVIDLDPTAPLRKVQDIKLAFKQFIERDADILYSVRSAERSPYFNMVELDEKGYGHLCKEPKERISGRQQAPKVYSINASIYMMKTDFLKKMSTVVSGKNIIYEMDDICIDIDREIDFKFIEFMLKEDMFKFDY